MVTRPVSSESYSGPDRRNGNGNGLSGVPAWVRAIAIVGIPGAIAIYLVWIGAQLAPRILSGVDGNSARIQELLKAHDAHIAEVARMRRQIQRLCIVLAKDDVEDRERCFDE